MFERSFKALPLAVMFDQLPQKWPVPRQGDGIDNADELVARFG